MKLYFVIAAFLLGLTGMAGLATADKPSPLQGKPVSYKVPSSHKGKTLAELGKIVSIQEVSYRDKINKAFKTADYEEEGLEGLDPKFLSRHLYRYRMIPEAEYRTAMAIMFKPSFEVRYVDGSSATVYPRRVYFRPAEGEGFSCWLDDLPNEKAEQGADPNRDGAPSE